MDVFLRNLLGCTQSRCALYIVSTCKVCMNPDISYWTRQCFMSIYVTPVYWWNLFLIHWHKWSNVHQSLHTEWGNSFMKHVIYSNRANASPSLVSEAFFVSWIVTEEESCRPAALVLMRESLSVGSRPQCWGFRGSGLHGTGSKKHTRMGTFFTLYLLHSKKYFTFHLYIHTHIHVISRTSKNELLIDLSYTTNNTAYKVSPVGGSMWLTYSCQLYCSGTVHILFHNSINNKHRWENPRATLNTCPHLSVHLHRSRSHFIF